MHEQVPLAIKKECASQESVSYQAPWDNDMCIWSLQSTTMYQGGGNISWIHPGSSTPSWANVSELADTFFGPQKWHETVAKGGRIRFPFILEAYITEVSAAHDMTVFNSSLPLLAGQAMVQAWWVALYRGVIADGAKPGYFQHIAALWQCGLTTTILLRCPHL